MRTGSLASNMTSRPARFRQLRRALALAICAVGGCCGLWPLANSSAVEPPPEIARRQLEARVARQEIIGTPTPENPLSVVDLEQMALTSNPSLARAQARVAAAQGNWVQVGLMPNPTVGYSGQQLGSDGRAEQQGVMTSQEIVRGGKLRLNREVAAQEIAKAQQELAVQQQRVVTDVRLTFYDILVAKAQLDVALDLERIADEGINAAEALLRAKEVSRADLLQAQLERENAQIITQNSRNRFNAAWQGLAAVVGRSHMEPVPVTGDLEAPRGEFSWDGTLQQLLGRSPRISVAVAEIERSRWALQRARVEPRPNVTVDGLVNVIDNGINGDPDGALLVTLPLPVWNKNQGRIAQASAEVIAAERGLEQLELQLQRQLAPVYERYANARYQVDRYRTKILPVARESLELTRKSYQAGETNYVSLLTVQRTNSQTNLNYIQSLRELRMAEIELEGLLLRDSLDSN